MFRETPLLKPTLDAAREDKDGAVFYRLSDPTTGRQYRLYEIEYRIAQMLDGRTALSDIAVRVRDKLRFDLSPNDLERFVKELEALGFLSSTGRPAPKTNDEPMSLSADDIIEDAEVAEVDKMAVTDELDRLVRSALLHVKQGMVAQARDYLLAARKYAPSDEKVGTMLNHLDVVGEDDGPSDIEYLWLQAAGLYPDLAQEIGPPGIGLAPIPIEEKRDRQSSRLRPLIYLGVLVVLGTAGFFGWEKFGLLRPIVEIEIERVRTQRVHLFYDAQAIEVGPRETFPHAFEKAGVVAEVLVKVGENVSTGALLARQKLPAADEKTLAGLRKMRQVAEKAHLRAATEVETLTTEIGAKADEGERVKADIDALQKAIMLKPASDRAAAKKELVALKKAQATVKKDLAALKKKSVAPLKALAKLKKAFDTTKGAEDAFIEKSSASFLRATAEGQVSAIGVEVRAKADPSQPAVTVADTSALRIRWKSADARLISLPEDSKVKLFFRDGELQESRISKTGDGGVSVELSDREAAIAGADKESLKLVRETLDNALIVSATAKVGKSNAYVVEQGAARKGVAVKRTVDWVEVRGREAIARAGLQAGDSVVIGPDQVLRSFKEDRVDLRLPARGMDGAQ